MSPSEDELRGALRDGEGERPDVDRIVAAGVAARARRRTRLAQVAAAVALVVAAGGITTAVVRGGDDPRTTSADGAGRAEQQQRGGDGAANGTSGTAGIAPGEPTPGLPAPSSLSPTPATSPRAAACPPRFPLRALPGGGTARAGSGPLFDRPAVAITVCGYGSPLLRAEPARLVVTGAQATTLQRSLENARTTPAGAACTAVRASETNELAFLGVDAAGASLRTVTTTLTLPVCDNRTTNGSAVRFGWVPPSELSARLVALTPANPRATLPSRSPSGKNIGTPVR